MTNRIRFRPCACLLALLLLPATGRGSEFVFEHVSLADGLSQSSVQAMLQGPDGYLWIGTQYGLDRFDGYGFRNWGPGESSSNGLSHGFVRSLMFDRDGMLWIGTSNGLNRLDPRSGRIRQYFPEGVDTGHEMIAFHEDSLVEDDPGDILASTSHGPMRWNRATDRLEAIAIDQTRAAQSSARLLRDATGSTWLANHNRLWRLDENEERFATVIDLSNRIKGGFGKVPENIAVALPYGGLAWATEIGLIVVESNPENEIRHIKPVQMELDGNRVDAVALDTRGHLWLRTRDAIVRSNGTNWDQWQVMLESPRRLDLTRNDRENLDLAETRDGRIWLGGRFGVAVLEPDADRLQLLALDPEDPGSLPPTLAEVGYRLLADRFGVLWVGTNLGGLARLPPQSARFTHVRDTRPGGRSRNIVRAIAEQRQAGKEWVWVGNQNAGVTAWQRDKTGRYTVAAAYAQTLDNLPEDTVRAIAPAPDNSAVWMAGNGWLGRVTRPGAQIEIVPAEFNGTLRSLRFDADGRLWAETGSSLHGFTFDQDGTATLKHKLNLTPEGFSSRFEVFSFCFRRNGQIAAAGYGGIALADPTSGVASHFLPAGEPGHIPENLVFHVHCADDGTVWFGTRGAGLGRLQFDTDGEPQFEFIGTEHGLADGTVYGILPGPEGELWLSSNRGLMRFSPETGQIDSFGPGDGVQEYEFNNTVAHIGSSGRYYFGGINGWNVFDPESIQPLPDPPFVHAESIRVNDRKLAPGTDDQKRIELAHDQNRLEIEYTGLHFAAPDLVRYAYRLRGLDENWIDAGQERLARYASLPPGNYTFEVRAANPDGVWSAPETLLRAAIKPPIWVTPWAWGAYALALVLALWVMFATHRRRERRLQSLVDHRTAQLREQHAIVERQAGELAEALQARTTLFANISHEFRTPLTLIGAAFDKLEHKPDPDAVALGRRYGNRLLRLVEQLLDLSRLKPQRHARSTEAWQLDALVAQTVQAFDSVARKVQVTLKFDINGRWQTRCPQEIVEKILLNLLTNAIKYTPPGGHVRVGLDGHAEGVELTIRDTGPGIPEAEQAIIFERFYRTESAESGRSHGAGIGLALVKEAVAVLGGTIGLKSAPGAGSTFSVQLPARPVEENTQASAHHAHPTRGPANSDGSRTPILSRAGSCPPPPAGEGMGGGVNPRRRQLELEVLAASAQPDHRAGIHAEPRSTARGTILIVEDNHDLRAWVAGLLADQWRVLEAADGQAGLDQARSQAPDIIISDLMMPVLDGFGMLEALRKDAETSHIPVLMLTARQDDQTRLKAFTLSADAFLSKPFNVEELKSRLDQIIESRDRLQRFLQYRLQRYVRGRHADPLPFDDPGSNTGDGREPGDPNTEPATPGKLLPEADQDLSRHDIELLARIEAWLDKCHRDPDADIKAMAEAAYVTPRTLQRKLKALTGDSPAQVLRNHRLQCACHELTETDRPITEIAHACGFSSAQYFSRVFREAFGQSPDKWRQEHD